MTLGIGIRPSREAGVVLIADSLQPYRWSDGSRSYEVDRKKLMWLGGSETAVVISGNIDDDLLASHGVLPDHRPLVPGLPQEPDPRSRVRRTFGAIQRIDAAVRARHPGEDRYAAMSDPG